MANYFSIFQDSDHAGVGNGDPATRTKTPAVEGNINVKDPGTENALINLQYQDNDLWGSVLRSQLYYNDLLTRFAKFPGFDQVEIRSEKLGARATIDTPLAVGSTTWNALWGVDYLHDRTRQPSLDGPTTTPEMVQDAGAVFLQLEAPAGAWGLLRGGVRHEYITVDIDSVTNRQDVFVQGGRLNFNETLFNLSGILYLTDRLELFGGYSQGFSLADLGRAIADTTETDVEALESEVQTVDNYELGLRTVRSRWDASLAVFYNESENGTTFNQALEIVKQPERVYGIELATNLKLVERVQVGGTATWMEGEVDLDDDGDYDEDLPSTRVPPLKVTAYTEYRPYHWWSLRLQGLYSGERSPESSQFGGAEVEDYTLLDLYSGFELPRGRLEIGIENLINEDYFTVLSQAGALPYAFSKGPGRTISATYSLAW